MKHLNLGRMFRLKKTVYATRRNGQLRMDYPECKKWVIQARFSCYDGEK